MALRHEGVSPGKIWYAWQKTKGLLKTFSDSSYSRDAKVMARHSGIAAGLAAAGYALQATVYIPLLVPFGSTIVAVGGAGWFGWRACQKAKLLKNSPIVSKYVRAREEAWLARKTRPPLAKRLGASFKRGFGKALLPFVKIGKWLGLAGAGAGAALGVAGGLQMAGIEAIPVAITSAIGSAGAGLGLTASAALLAATGLCVLAIPLGLGASFLCKIAADKLENNFIAHQAEKKPMPVLKNKAEEKPQNPRLAKANNSFNAVAPAAESVLSEQRRKNAEERAKNRARAKNSGQQRFR